jgi:hypothetical protein
MDQNFFRLNEPDVSAEDFRSEILAVNLKNGYYHSLRDSAVPIWRLLMEGRSVQTIVQLLTPIYGGDQAVLAADVSLFISELEKGGLIVRDSSPAETPSTSAPDWLADVPPTYAKPLMETYTEMQDLLLLDPIHDVDATGWPNVAEPKTDTP